MDSSTLHYKARASAQKKKKELDLISGSQLGKFGPSWGHLAMSGDIFVVTAGDGGGGALGIEWVETRMLSIQK